MPVAYLDSSAFVKVIIREPESNALRKFLKVWPDRTSSALLRVESIRAVRPHGPQAIRKAAAGLATVNIIAIDNELLDAAGRLEPIALRSLDAIHLASALTLGDELGVLVTYDERMAEASKEMAIQVESPGRS